MSAADIGCKGRWCHVKSRVHTHRRGSSSHTDVMKFVIFANLGSRIPMYGRFLMQTRWNIPGSLHGLSIIEMTVLHLLCFFVFCFPPLTSMEKELFSPHDAVLLLLPLLLSATEAVPQSLGTTLCKEDDFDALLIWTKDVALELEPK